jgi:glycosyltransferase involved in cell wall biosynthesis
MKSPQFSIIIPTFNRATLIWRAVESVMHQTWQDWELIVIDDGSTDNTAEIINSYQDERIRYFYQENQERNVARNNGIEQAHGKYVCFLDSDDYFLPNRLQGLYNCLQNSKFPVACFFTDIIFTDHKGFFTESYYSVSEPISLKFLVLNVIGVPQVCIHGEILKEQLFNPKFHIGEDLELWIRIAEKWPIHYLSGQNSIIALIHEGRSVNEKMNNVGVEQLMLLRFIFSQNHPGYKVSSKVKRERISDAYFSIARHYMYNKRKWLAIRNLYYSIFEYPGHKQTKHKLFIILKLFFRGNIDEYKL